MKKPLLFFILATCTVFHAAYAQRPQKIKTLPTALPTVSAANKTTATTYGLEITAATYTDLVNPVSINGSDVWDDPDDYAVPLGFSFKLFDKTVDTIYMNEYGCTFYTASINSVNATDSVSKFHAFDADLFDRGTDVGAGTNSLSPISYKTTGAAPSRITKVEFKNAGFYEDFEDSMFINFQVWFFEGSNNIEIHFGSHFVKNAFDTYDNRNGARISLVENFVPIVGTATGTIYMLAGDSNSPMIYTVSSTMPEDTTITGTPANGRVYRFVYNGSGTINGIASLSSLKQVVSIAPNPATEAVTITSSAAGSLHFSMTDISGRLICSGTLRGTETLPLSALHPGIYFLKINGDGYETLTQKIVKQ